MSWLIFSIVPPALWALSNHIDKYMLGKFFKNRDGGPFMLFTAFFGILVALYVLIFRFGSISTDPKSALIMLVSGAASFLSGYLYLVALKKDSPSVVVPLFQLIPIFRYFLGMFFLNEFLSGPQIFACLLVIAGSMILTLESVGNKFKLKMHVILPMLLCTLVTAVNGLAFKYVAVESNYWNTQFWDFLGLFIAGVVVFNLNPSWRKVFSEIIGHKKSFVLGITFFNEIINVAAGLIFTYAMLLMPLAIVSVVSNGLQPFFVLLFGVILTLLTPKLAHVTLSKRNLVQKIIAIGVIFLGTYLLNR